MCVQDAGEKSFLIYVDKKERKIPAHLYPNLCDPMDCSPSGSSIHGILQAKTLMWVAIPFSRGSSQLRGWTQVSCIAGRFFTIWATRKGSVLISNAMVGENRHAGIKQDIPSWFWTDSTVRRYTSLSNSENVYWSKVKSLCLRKQSKSTSENRLKSLKSLVCLSVCLFVFGQNEFVILTKLMIQIK